MTPAKPTDRGLRCSSCGGQRLRVVYTRARRGGCIVRRRECVGCRARLTTWEKPVSQV